MEAILFISASTALLFLYARAFPLGAVGLPFITVLTCLIYFGVLLPLSAFAGSVEFLGMPFPTMTEQANLHLLLLMHLTGCSLAFLMVLPRKNKFTGHLKKTASPSTRENRASVDRAAFSVLSAFIFGVTIYLLATKQIALFGGEISWSLKEDNLLFLNQAYNLAIPMALVIFVRNRGGRIGWAAVGITAFFLVILGFRFRLVLLFGGLLTCLVIVKNWKVSAKAIGVGAVIAILLFNVFASIRTYNAGLDLSRLDDQNLLQIAINPGAEVGPVLVATQAANSGRYAGTIGVDPWLIGLARLVPSAVWSEKPTAYYLEYSFDGFNLSEALGSGIAPPQISEMLWQFGWLGVFPLSFCYFFLASAIFLFFWRRSTEYDIVGVSLAPWFFGFYMQSRGYFAQILSDSLFIILPLVLLSLLSKKNRGILRYHHMQ